MEDLLEYLAYAPHNGCFRWYKARGRNSHCIGQIAGTVTADGYVRIVFKGKSYLAHRIVWFLAHGTWPEEIDHKNGNRQDNRLGNLRASTKRQNQQNRKSHRMGRLVGARWEPRRSHWICKRVVDGKQRYLGSFATELEAHQKYMEFE